jgi:hypothetical protein
MRLLKYLSLFVFNAFFKIHKSILFDPYFPHLGGLKLKIIIGYAGIPAAIKYSGKPFEPTKF